MEWDPAGSPASTTYRFLTSAVAPRPIAWVTTVDPAGTVNAAPFSWFNSVCPDPPLVMLAIGSRDDGSPKDTWANIEATREFVVNAVVRGLEADAVASSADYAPGRSEAEALGLRLAPSAKVRPPRLAASPIHLECVLDRAVTLGRHDDHHLVLGRVVHVAVDDAVLDARGLVDPSKAIFVGRMGSANYMATTDRFTVPWPAKAGDRLRANR